MEKDIVIIGGGPGGYVAAIRGAQLGGKVTLIEENALGGTCLNVGCIPTKALYKNAEVISTLKNIEEFGIKGIENYSIDVEKIQERKQNVIDQLVGGIHTVLSAYGVEILRGRGTILNKNLVKTTLVTGEEREIPAKNIIIATGAKPTLPPIPGIHLNGVMTSNELLSFKEIPKRLAIIGGGVIGIEFAGIFNALGSEVTVFEFAPSILIKLDKDISKRLTTSLKKDGIKINTSTGVEEIKESNGSLVVVAKDKKGSIEVEVDQVLVSVGRTPVIEGLNLEGIGIELDRKRIQVNDRFETNVKGIYAIGDVNGGMMLAHEASHEGKSVAEIIMGAPVSEDRGVVPSCIFISPEISTVGITEEDAKEQGIDYKTSKFMFGANGKALSMGEPQGFVKVISTGKNNRIIGVHIMGPHAADLIHEGALAIRNQLTADDIASTIHAHPTLGEAFVEAVMGLTNEAIHMVPSKR